MAFVCGVYSNSVLVCGVFYYFVLFAVDAYSVRFSTCVDRPYFYYDCAQLIGYCHLPHAERVRESCPSTCGLCAGAVDGEVLSTVTLNDGELRDRDAPLPPNLGRRRLTGKQKRQLTALYNSGPRGKMRAQSIMKAVGITESYLFNSRERALHLEGRADGRIKPSSPFTQQAGQLDITSFAATNSHTLQARQNNVRNAPLPQLPPKPTPIVPVAIGHAGNPPVPHMQPIDSVHRAIRPVEVTFNSRTSARRQLKAREQGRLQRNGRASFENPYNAAPPTNYGGAPTSITYPAPQENIYPAPSENIYPAPSENIYPAPTPSPTYGGGATAQTSYAGVPQPPIYPQRDGGTYRENEVVDIPGLYRVQEPYYGPAQTFETDNRVDSYGGPPPSRNRYEATAAPYAPQPPPRENYAPATTQSYVAATTVGYGGGGVDTDTASTPSGAYAPFPGYITPVENNVPSGENNVPSGESTDDYPQYPDGEEETTDEAVTSAVLPTSGDYEYPEYMEGEDTVEPTTEAVTDGTPDYEYPEYMVGEETIEPTTEAATDGTPDYEYAEYPEESTDSDTPATAIPTDVVATDVMPTEVMPTEVIATEVIATEGTEVYEYDYPEYGEEVMGVATTGAMEDAPPTTQPTSLHEYQEYAEEEGAQSKDEQTTPALYADYEYQDVEGTKIVPRTIGGEGPEEAYGYVDYSQYATIAEVPLPGDNSFPTPATDLDPFPTPPPSLRGASPDEKATLPSDVDYPFTRRREAVLRRPIVEEKTSPDVRVMPSSRIRPESRLAYMSKPFNSTGRRNDLDPRLAVEFRLQQCCRLNQITPFCQSLCSYTVTKEQIYRKAGSGECAVRDAAIWIKCTSGGHENAPCCRSRGVTNCDNFCNGKAQMNELLSCAGRHLNEILMCHRDNLIRR